MQVVRGGGRSLREVHPDEYTGHAHLVFESFSMLRLPGKNNCVRKMEIHRVGCLIIPSLAQYRVLTDLKVTGCVVQGFKLHPGPALRSVYIYRCDLPSDFTCVRNTSVQSFVCHDATLKDGVIEKMQGLKHLDVTTTCDYPCRLDKVEHSKLETVVLCGCAVNMLKVPRAKKVTLDTLGLPDITEVHPSLTHLTLEVYGPVGLDFQYFPSLSELCIFTRRHYHRDTTSHQPNVLKNIDCLRNLTLFRIMRSLQLVVPAPGPWSHGLHHVMVKNCNLSEFPAFVLDSTSLRYLDLSENNISSIPAEISRLWHLQELNLRFNLLEQIPSAVFQLTSLHTLYLSNNRIQALPPEIGQLTKLENLSLDHNNAITSLPPQIGQLTCLQHLSVTYTSITVIPPEIGQLRRLMYLELSRTQLTSLPLEICRLVSLRRLELFETKVSSLPPALFRLPMLSNIDTDSVPTERIPYNCLEASLSLLYVGSVRTRHRHNLVLKRNRTIRRHRGTLCALMMWSQRQGALTTRLPLEIWHIILRKFMA